MMNVTLHKIINELEKLGLKQIYNGDDLVKFSYGDCNSTFIIIDKQKNCCTIFRQLRINTLGLYYMMAYTRYNLLSYMENPITIDAIISEMKILISRYKELKVYFKKYQIEQDFV